MVAVNHDVAEHRVADGGLQLLAAVLDICLLEVVVGAGEAADLVLSPILADCFAESLLQQGVAALLGELEEVDLCQLVEVEELVVQIDLVAAACGHDADNVADDVDRVKELEHADALVALLDIEAVHVFISLDRIADTLGHVSLTQMLPLVGELCRFVENGHEVRREGVDPAAGFCADDKLGGNLNQSEIDASVYHSRGHKILEYGQTRRLSLKRACPRFLLTELQRVLVVKFVHNSITSH